MNNLPVVHHLNILAHLLAISLLRYYRQMIKIFFIVVVAVVVAVVFMMLFTLCCNVMLFIFNVSLIYFNCRFVKEKLEINGELMN